MPGGTVEASVLKDPASATNNLATDASGNIVVGNALTVTGAAAIGTTANITGLLTLGASGARIINGSNTSNIAAPSTAGTYTLTLPATSGTVAYVNSNVLPAYDGSNLTGIVTGGMTLISTVSASSQNTLVFSGLNLSSYRELYIIIRTLTNSGTSSSLSLNNYAASGGVQITANPSNVNGLSGYVRIDLYSGYYFSISGAANQATVTANAFSLASPSGSTALFGYSGIKNATTSVTFYSSISSSNYNGGAVDFYGVK